MAPRHIPNRTDTTTITSGVGCLCSWVLSAKIPAGAIAAIHCCDPRGGRRLLDPMASRLLRKSSSVGTKGATPVMPCRGETSGRSLIFMRGGGRVSETGNIRGE